VRPHLLGCKIAVVFIILVGSALEWIYRINGNKITVAVLLGIYTSFIMKACSLSGCDVIKIYCMLRANPGISRMLLAGDYVT